MLISSEACILDDEKLGERRHDMSMEQRIAVRKEGWVTVKGFVPNEGELETVDRVTTQRYSIGKWTILLCFATVEGPLNMRVSRCITKFSNDIRSLL